MTFVIPNLPASASVKQQAQSAPDQYDFQAITNADAVTGVVSGCVVSAHAAALSLDITAGVVAVGGVEVSVAVVSGLAITAADGTNPRFDLCVVSSAGTVSMVNGTAAASPVFPALTTAQVLLAAVYVGAGVTTIAAADLVAKGVGVPPSLGAVNRIAGSDRTIPASYSVVVSEDYEIAAGVTLDIGALGVLEIL